MFNINNLTFIACSNIYRVSGKDVSRKSKQKGQGQGIFYKVVKMSYWYVQSYIFLAQKIPCNLAQRLCK